MSSVLLEGMRSGRQDEASRHPASPEGGVRLVSSGRPRFGGACDRATATGSARAEKLSTVGSPEVKGGGVVVKRKRTAIPKERWEWFGNAAHFICSQWCRFHLATKIGKYIVSTVGQYVPDEGTREIVAKSKGIVLEGRGDHRLDDFMAKIGFREIGYGRTYETMVFVAGKRCVASGCGCGMPTLKTATELASASYNDARAATKGHHWMCLKWASAR